VFLVKFLNLILVLINIIIVAVAIVAGFKSMMPLLSIFPYVQNGKYQQYWMNVNLLRFQAAEGFVKPAGYELHREIALWYPLSLFALGVLFAGELTSTAWGIPPEWAIFPSEWLR